jgi:hypothetical protein
MIVYKQWRKYTRIGNVMYEYEGWFLLGVIPLFISRLGWKPK